MLSRTALRQQLDDLHRETLKYKISIYTPDKHPQFERLRPKNPVAALEIPKQLFLLWSELRRKQDELAIPASSYVELLHSSLEANDGFTIYPPSTELESRLRKESSKTNKKAQRKRWQPREKLRCGLMFMMIYEQEGRLQLQATDHTAEANEQNKENEVVPKLHVKGT